MSRGLVLDNPRRNREDWVVKRGPSFSVIFHFASNRDDGTVSRVSRHWRVGRSDGKVAMSDEANKAEIEQGLD